MALQTHPTDVNPQFNFKTLTKLPFTSHQISQNSFTKSTISNDLRKFRLPYIISPRIPNLA
uniref:Uncharacterized protein n=1 Tax=Helianthus annuus TaxID=4232 RepID=A0A251TSL4_HELAN